MKKLKNMVHDLVIRLKNGYLARKHTVDVLDSKMNEKIVEILKKEKYIKDYKIIEADKKRAIRLELLFREEKPAVSGVKLVSRPGRRMFHQVKNLNPVQGGLGVSILSTPRGIITDKEARSQNIGGEELFRIW